MASVACGARRCPRPRHASRHIVTRAVGPVAYGNSGRFDVDPMTLNIMCATRLASTTWGGMTNPRGIKALAGTPPPDSRDDARALGDRGDGAVRPGAFRP